MDTSSSTKKMKQVRNWAELPPDVLSLIFIKLGVFEMLRGPRTVCSVWRKISKEPHLYRIVDFRNLPKSYVKHQYVMVSLVTFAEIQSAGQLIEFSVDTYPTASVLRVIMHKSILLKCLRIANGERRVEKVLIEMVKKVPQLEELEICHCLFTTKTIEAFGSSCLQLKSFRLNHVGYKGPVSEDSEDEALAIAKNMPELRHLHIFGNLLTDNGLGAILDGCPHLKTLDLRQCFNVLFEGDLKKRCEDANIKLRLPDDSTDDYEFNPHFNTCPGSDDEDYSYEYNYGGLTASSSDSEFDEAAYIEAYIVFSDPPGFRKTLSLLLFISSFNFGTTFCFLLMHVYFGFLLMTKVSQYVFSS